FFATNWIPLAQNHWLTYIIQIAIGFGFTAIYFFLFKFLIIKFNIPLPGRKKDDKDMKLYNKDDYKNKDGKAQVAKKTESANEFEAKAIYYLEGLGGKENIKDVTNCTTRLRLTVNDVNKVEDSDYFTHKQMAHGLVKSGKNVQVVVGMSVPQVREAFENLVFEEKNK
ncbi:glucose PTS transporter subunit EIIB, partial [Staphylococcus ureilyticus]|nr:glucose PTS transporter subunit EIIB [Staphylococcus ureilyticus]